MKAMAGYFSVDDGLPDGRQVKSTDQFSDTCVQAFGISKADHEENLGRMSEEALAAIAKGGPTLPVKGDPILVLSVQQHVHKKGLNFSRDITTY